MSEELPDGWAQTSLSELLREPLRNGHSARASSDGSGVRTLSLSAVTYGDFSEKNTKLTIADPSKISDLWLEPGDLLIERSNTPELVGTTRLYRGERHFAIFPDLVIRVRLLPYALPSLVELMLQSAEVRKYFTDRAQGTSVSMPKIDQGAVLDVPIALPPIAEQNRIVAKVEALMTEVSATRGRLAKVSLILKRFRHAVLSAACSAKLTEGWRETHRASETASELVAKIDALRKANVESHAAVANEGIELPDAELPSSWTWCRVGEIADVRLGGTPSRKEPSYWGGKIPWVSSGEVANRRIASTAETITRDGLENSNAKMYPKGTVLIAMIGEGKTRGQAALLDIEACTNQNAAGLVFVDGAISPEYIWYWALGEYDKTREVGRGGNQAALNGAKVRALPVPLPPLEEQLEIVRRVEALFALADSIERRLAVAIARTDKVPQAILAKAFRGELVPTEAELARAEGRDYEPASALLERIRKEREAAGPTAGRGRKKAAPAKDPVKATSPRS